MIESTLLFLQEHIWFIVFLLWGLPLTYYRSNFRKAVYGTTHWSINIKPVFVKEAKALLGLYITDRPDFVRLRKFYRIYLIIYSALFVIQLIV